MLNVSNLGMIQVNLQSSQTALPEPSRHQPGTSTPEQGQKAEDSPTLAKLRRFAATYSAKSGCSVQPDADVTEGVLSGLATNVEATGRPLCPCRFYPDKQAEAEHRTWACACDDMQIYKFCHCLLFTNEDGLPITEYLPEDHPGRRTYGLVRDPDPSRGRALRHKAEARERERESRKS